LDCRLLLLGLRAANGICSWWRLLLTACPSALLLAIFVDVLPNAIAVGIVARFWHSKIPKAHASLPRRRPGGHLLARI